MISIVIPVFNQHEMTEACLKSVRDNTKGYEVIFIDNGSKPPLAHTDGYSFDVDVKIIRNEENKGFPAAVNQGIQAAKGDVIILLNNDAIVTPGWSERLVSYLDRFGVIGPLTNFCAGMQQTTVPAYYDEADLYRVASEWQESHKGQVTEVRWVIGFCMAFKKSLYDELGAFDESLWPCSGEEIDFCLRAKKKGYKVGIAKDVYIHHEGSQTFRSMDVDYNAICERNDKHLQEKWGENVWTNQVSTQNDEGVKP